MKWDDIAKRLPGRSSISCRLRYQNYLEKRAVWDEEKKNKLARLYARYVMRTSSVVSNFPASRKLLDFWSNAPYPSMLAVVHMGKP